MEHGFWALGSWGSLSLCHPAEEEDRKQPPGLWVKAGLWPWLGHPTLGGTLASLNVDKSPEFVHIPVCPLVVATALGVGSVISGWQELQWLVQGPKGSRAESEFTPISNSRVSAPYASLGVWTLPLPPLPWLLLLTMAVSGATGRSRASIPYP